MEKIKAGIFSFYMKNIPQGAVEAQRNVVAKFNKSGYPHHQILTDMRHGYSMDAAWHLNGINVQPQFVGKFPNQFDYDVMVFLDIDAVPLNTDALDFYVEHAFNGALVGNIQRTNHIQNGEHTFVAPSAMAISTSTFLTIGQPSALETSRSDVGEEMTWLCEKAGIKVIKFMPLRFEKAPDEAPNGWNLASGMPKYGLGTTFGDNSIVERPMMWHNFQVRLPGQPERFMRKCSELLNDGGTDGESQQFQQQTTEGHQANT